MSIERTVTITDDDVRFVQRALQHYQIFAAASEAQRDDRTTGIMRGQEFYAERFLLRLNAGTPL